jgi:hypothetical protein
MKIRALSKRPNEALGILLPTYDADLPVFIPEGK